MAVFDITSEIGKEIAHEFSKRYVRLLLEMKKIKQDIAALKQEYAEKGLNAAGVIRVIKEIQKEIKMGQEKVDELYEIKTSIGDCAEMLDLIAELQRKD